MSNERLQELRGQVDVINMQILELLSKRASIVTEIGKLHTSMGNEHYDPEREAHGLFIGRRERRRAVAAQEHPTADLERHVAVAPRAQREVAHRRGR